MFLITIFSSHIVISSKYIIVSECEEKLTLMYTIKLYGSRLQQNVVFSFYLKFDIVVICLTFPKKI